ncbi:AraC family transcriptional regulator [Clostridium sp. BL-8]|uniref:AraC family transcriptional regulator n=1 Tax=Clostridium sp. BL-8 TaxID=349938 RepID=UPI00098C1105|nr:AraC family transcriptional regulator [Clostridium sp. BL-8]OOM78021.1 exoenzyme S synthesis regulatory protein ExsA [Clostridium sp. BL-8]
MNNINEDNTVLAKQKELAHLIEQFATKDGFNSTAIPTLDLIRASSEHEQLFSIYEPSLCIIAQGSKVVLLGTETYKYDPTSYLVASVKLPVTCKILEATSKHPYLCINLTFTSDQILQILKESQDVFSENNNLGKGVVVNKTTSILLDAAIRLVNLLNKPKDIPVLAPLFIHEILYYILQDNQGYLVNQFIGSGSNTHSIAKAIHLINNNFSKPLRINDLAKNLNMSPSSLHHQFKEVTAMSPLQYQKQIRLQEARRLLLSGITEAAEAGFQVGYESPSQFSREYARMFGMPPMNDMKRLKNMNIDFI